MPTKSKLTISGGGAYYSFTRLTHEYGYWLATSTWMQGWLSTGFAGADYGILTTLGDVPLENITVGTSCGSAPRSTTLPPL